MEPFDTKGLKLTPLLSALTNAVRNRHLDPSAPIPVVGVYGMVNVGKSTLIRHLGAQIIDLESTQPTPRTVYVLNLDPGQVMFGVPCTIGYAKFVTTEKGPNFDDESAHIEMFAYNSPIFWMDYFDFKLQMLSERFRANVPGNDIAAVLINTCGFFKEDGDSDISKMTNATKTYLKMIRKYFRPTMYALIGYEDKYPEVYYDKMFKAPETPAFRLGLSESIKTVENRRIQPLVMLARYLNMPNASKPEKGIQRLQMDRLAHNIYRYGALANAQEMHKKRDGRNLVKYLPAAWVQAVNRETVGYVLSITPLMKDDFQRPGVRLFDQPILGVLLIDGRAEGSSKFQVLCSLPAIPENSVLQRTHFQLTADEMEFFAKLIKDNVKVPTSEMNKIV